MPEVHDRGVDGIVGEHRFDAVAAAETLSGGSQRDSVCDSLVLQHRLHVDDARAPRHCVGATRSSERVASVECRIAHEHPIPGPLEDRRSALTWLVAQPSIDRTGVAIGGANTTVGLAAALASVPDSGEITPAFRPLSYLMLNRVGRRTTVAQV
jgi:hypothetical protein